jgi:hypothetical protein
MPTVTAESAVTVATKTRIFIKVPHDLFQVHHRGWKWLIGSEFNLIGCHCLRHAKA